MEGCFVYRNYLLVLVKVLTPVRTSSTSMTESFSLSRTCVHIYSDNVRESRQCVILHLYLIKWLESTAVNFKNRVCNGIITFVREICFIQACRGTVNNCRQHRKVGGATRFSCYICQCIKEMIMWRDLLLF